MNRPLVIPTTYVESCIGTFSSAKVVGKPTYIPATRKLPEQKCIFNVYVRTLHNKDNEGCFTIIAKGRQADACARGLSEDREIDCVYIPHSKHGKIELVLKDIVFGPGPNVVINAKTKKHIIEAETRRKNSMN